MNALRSLCRAVMDALYPQKWLCLCCGQRPSHGEYLCSACAEALEVSRLTMWICPACGAEVTGSRCAYCEDWETETARPAYPHSGVARKLVHCLKYDNLADAAHLLAPAMAENAARLSLPPETVVTWVAMPEKRRRERGIDHGRILAEAVAAEMGLVSRPLLVRTKKHVHTQRGLHRAERLSNLRGVFACTEDIPSCVLLVDDVLTTGATAHVCASCLRTGGAQRVCVVTATQAQRKKTKEQPPQRAEKEGTLP